MSKRLILLVVVCSCGAAIVIAKDKAEKLPFESSLHKIESKKKEVRIEGKKEIEKQYADFVDKLIAIVDAPIKQGLHPLKQEDWQSPYNPRNIAIELLGDMRVPRAVPHIIPNLEIRKGQSCFYNNDGIPKPSPAEIALIRIGKPAVKPLVDTLAHDPKIDSWPSLEYSIMSTLYEIEGTNVFTIIKDAESKETDPHAKARLHRILRIHCKYARSGEDHYVDAYKSTSETKDVHDPIRLTTQ